MVKKQKRIILDEYEKEILEVYEDGRLRPSKSQADYQAIARNTMKKNRKINIRISENDLSALQRRAVREGIPYQTLIGGHRDVVDKLYFPIPSDNLSDGRCGYAQLPGCLSQ
jgi:predicted DNA binding CopG/RHH family protein